MSELSTPKAGSWFGRHLQPLSAAVSLVMFCLALAVLFRTLRHTDIHTILSHFMALPAFKIYTALLFAALGYLVLIGYDVLALRFVGRPLPLRLTALASFVSHSFANNIGLSLLTGGSIRYRIYSAAGLTAPEIAAVTSLCIFTFWIGVTFFGGVIILVEPAKVITNLPVPGYLVNSAAIAMIGAALTYLGWTIIGGPTLRIMQWRINAPPTRLTLWQFLLAGLDLSAAGATAYVLLPPEASIGFFAFLGVYIIATAVGAISHVPGGLGIFETLLLVMLPEVPPEKLLASTLAYRLIYYLVPLIIAAILIAGYETKRNVPALAHAGDTIGKIVTSMAPQIVGLAVLASGAVLVFSGALPIASSRLAMVRSILPLGLVEVSHLINGVTGLGLMILARGLFRRIDAAFQATAGLLILGILASLFKGFDFEEAIILAIVLVILLLSRDEFHRKGSLWRQRFTPGWIASVAVIFIGAIWLGAFSFKHVEYQHELWWRIAFNDDAPRFLRASVLLAVTGLLIGVWRLMRVQPYEGQEPTSEILLQTKSIIDAIGDLDSHFALLGDKQILFNQARDGFIMYGISHRSWIVLGDPVCPPDRMGELAWQFRELCDQHGGRPVFYQVGPEHLDLYLDLGLTMMKMGEAARVPLTGFTLEGGRRRSLRQARNRAVREGAVFEILPADVTPTIMAELKSVSQDWLHDKNTREKGFSLGTFDEAYLSNFPMAVLRVEGRIVAFANVLTASDKSGLTVDLMRHSKEAPEGAMDMLFCDLMSWGALNGYGYFDLGAAPLSGLTDHPLASVWQRVGTLIFRHGEYFFNFEGLRQYKEKFDPEWHPRYIAAPSGMVLPAILIDVAALISGGLGGLFQK